MRPSKTEKNGELRLGWRKMKQEKGEKKSLKFIVKELSPTQAGLSTRQYDQLLQGSKGLKAPGLLCVTWSVVIAMIIIYSLQIFSTTVQHHR